MEAFKAVCRIAESVNGMALVLRNTDTEVEKFQVSHVFFEKLENVEK